MRFRRVGGLWAIRHPRRGAYDTLSFRLTFRGKPTTDIERRMPGDVDETMIFKDRFVLTVPVKDDML